MSRLVEDMLLLAQAGEDGFLRPAVIELRPFLTDLVRGPADVGAAAPRARRDPGAALDADEDRLAQALRNLLRNAIAHTADDGAGRARRRGRGRPRALRRRRRRPRHPRSTSAPRSSTASTASTAAAPATRAAPGSGSRSSRRSPWPTAARAGRRLAVGRRPVPPRDPDAPRAAVPAGDVSGSSARASATPPPSVAGQQRRSAATRPRPASGAAPRPSRPAARAQHARRRRRGSARAKTAPQTMKLALWTQEQQRVGVVADEQAARTPLAKITDRREDQHRRQQGAAGGRGGPFSPVGRAPPVVPDPSGSLVLPILSSSGGIRTNPMNMCARQQAVDVEDREALGQQQQREHRGRGPRRAPSLPAVPPRLRRLAARPANRGSVWEDARSPTERRARRWPGDECSVREPLCMLSHTLRAR